MQFAFLGISYQNTELEVREKAAFKDQKKMDFFHEAEQAGIRQCMILSTCNRSEVFYFWKEEKQKKGCKGDPLFTNGVSTESSCLFLQRHI